MLLVLSLQAFAFRVVTSNNYIVTNLLMNVIEQRFGNKCYIEFNLIMNYVYHVKKCVLFICMYMPVCMMYVCMYVCMYVWMYNLCLYVRMFACMYIHV